MLDMGFMLVSLSKESKDMGSTSLGLNSKLQNIQYILPSFHKLHPRSDTSSYVALPNVPYLLNKQTLPKALRTHVLTALTSNFGLVALVQ